MAGIPLSFLRRNIRRVHGNPVLSRGAFFVHVHHRPKLGDVSTHSTGGELCKRKIPPAPKKSSVTTRRVVTPIAASSPWKGEPERDALFTLEADARGRIAEREGRLYFPARRRHFVSTVETVVVPCILKVPCTQRHKVCGRARVTSAPSHLTGGESSTCYSESGTRTCIHSDKFYEYVDKDVSMDPHYVNVNVMWGKRRLDETENVAKKKVRLESTLGKPKTSSTRTATRGRRKKRSQRARPKRYFKKRRRNSFIDDEAEEVPDEVAQAEDDAIKPELVG